MRDRRITLTAAGLILALAAMAAARDGSLGPERDAVAIASAINLTREDVPGFTDHGAPS
jgi:hypothetical protein